MPPTPSISLLRSLRLSLHPWTVRTCRECTQETFLARVERRRVHSSTPTWSQAYQSVTAVNAAKTIQPRFEQLYWGLEKLKTKAATHVDLSRLQLALKGLESANPTIRIAFLSVDHFDSVCQLACLLLADPLEPEGAWERTLINNRRADSTSLLLRYGDPEDSVSATSALDIKQIPSRVLERHNIEILLSRLSPSQVGSDQKRQHEQAELVPMVATPISTSGNTSLIRHPVHCALVLADGVDGTLRLGQSRMRLVSGTGSEPTVLVALNYGQELDLTKRVRASTLNMVSTEQAIEALNSIRQSKEHATDFATGWQESGLPEVADWMSKMIQKQPIGLPLAIRSLLWDLLTKATTSVVDRRGQMSAEMDSDMFQNQSQSLKDALRGWATSSHAELQRGTRTALNGDEWAKLRWWKLLWRTDDVGMILTQTLQQHWLPKSDRALTFLEGRCAEFRLDEAATSSGAHGTANTRQDQARLVEIAREQLAVNSIPKLEALSQKLILQTVSMATLSSAFTTLVYLSWPALTMFQASAFAALGFVWSLRRLQLSWEGARESWIEDFQEAGRKCLRDAEDNIRIRISKGPTTRHEDASAVNDLEMAETAIEEARLALINVEAEKGI